MSGRYGLEIRAASAADASGLAELFGDAGQPQPQRALAERLEGMRRQPGVVLLALDWGPPSGLIALTWRRTLLADTPAARIEHLLVAPERRRQGLGRLLLKAGSQAARSAGCGILEMAVDAEAEGLAAFCDAAGFARVEATYARPLRKRSL